MTTEKYSDVIEIQENIDPSKILSTDIVEHQTSSSTQSSSNILKDITETGNETISDNLIITKENIECQYKKLWKEHLYFLCIEETEKKGKMKEESTFAITSKKVNRNGNYKKNRKTTS